MPSVYDPASAEYDPDVAKSRWSDVKDQWKKFDAVRPPSPSPVTPPPTGGVVGDAAGAGSDTAEGTA